MVGESNQNVFLIQINTASSQNSNYPVSRYRDSTVLLIFYEIWTYYGNKSDCLWFHLSNVLMYFKYGWDSGNTRFASIKSDKT